MQPVTMNRGIAMTDWTALRKKWADARDKAGVKKGSVSGVSLGDAIEKVGKGKGYTSTLNALNALKADLAKYKGKIQKTHPDLSKWIDKTIADEAQDMANKVQLDIDSLRWIVLNMMAPSDVNIMTILPDTGLIQNVSRLMTQKDNPLGFAEAVQATGMFSTVPSVGPLMAKRIATMKAIKWQARLAGHDANYTELQDFANLVAQDLKDVLIWSKTTSLEAWGDCQQGMRTRRTSVDGLPYAQKAMKALLA